MCYSVWYKFNDYFEIDLTPTKQTWCNLLIINFITNEHYYLTVYYKKKALKCSMLCHCLDQQC
jgi:hypothetical protein